MSDQALINYTPPPIVSAYIKRYLPGELFYDWIVGPYGSAKTTGMFFKLAYMASLQEPSPDGIRYSRAVVVRNTMPQLRDSTLQSWDYWFKDGQAGKWIASENTFVLKFSDVECEVLFRPLDTPADVVRVLGLEVTFALIDEFREIPKTIIEGLSGRLGRYKPLGDVKVTNWGMWGASNPGTEDNWWYDFLHTPLQDGAHRREGTIPIMFPREHEKQKEWQAQQGFPSDDETTVDMDGNITHVNNSWYFKQPSGFSKDAENIENLPGRRSYYINQAKGKSQAWVKQYIEAEWGFSAAGTAVISTFVPEFHIASSELRFNPRLQLVIGIDPGLGGSALIFMQQDMNGCVSVLGELVQRGIGVKRIIEERLRPYVRDRFPNARVVFAPDPAAGNRSSNDEKTAVQVLRSFGYAVSIETNNRLPLRINAIDYFCTRNVGRQYGLQIDPVHCPVLIRALKGGWRFGVDVKKDELKGAEPEKNQWSHPGDALGYGCRYFHKGLLKEEQGRGKPLPKLNYSGNAYHAR